MTEQRSTRLRYIIASNPDDLIQAVERLLFKVEIKGSPIPYKKGWILWFTIQDNAEMQSINLMS